MSSKTLYQFAGIRSNLPKSVTMENYINAINLYNEGAETREVLRETGWFKGVDGIMRYEISDHEAEIDTSKLRELEEGKIDSYSLGSILKHDALYEAYPSLKNIRFKLDPFDDDPNIGGSWNATKASITVNKAIITNLDTLIETLLHEVQHSIQSIEGFSNGGNTNKGFAESILPNIESNVSLAQLQHTEWHQNNKEKYEHAINASLKARYARLFMSFRKLQKYANSNSPSRVKRHIENEASWLYSDLFKVEGTNMTTPSAAHICVDWYNMPTRNNNRQKDIFLSNWATKCADVYLEQIPLEYREEFLWHEGDFRKHMDKLRTISDGLNSDILDLKVVQSELSSAKRSLDNFHSHRKLSEETKNHFLAPTLEERIYTHLTGEIEANNTSARRLMTPEERLQKAFDTTQDKPSHQHIVYFRGNSYRSFKLESCVNNINPKGSVTFGNENFAKLTLNKNADLSTVIHEGAHIYIEALTDIVKSDMCTDRAKKTLSDILDWLGTDTDEWLSLNLDQRKDLHEVFAEGFEEFVSIPSEKNPLFRIFDNFKIWIESIYNALNEIPKTKPLTASVEDLFREFVDIDTERSEFADKLSASITRCSDIEGAQAIAASKIIEKSMLNLTELTGIESEKLNDIFSIEVITPNAPKACHKQQI
ncbi:LPD23 domain-containing protein [Vibrio sp. D431a]|uniref:LPD23 domain-containing protein n=1 Tax=Vibrio sp. D431a TaxID=2837388 RepID=UPI0025524855|nr:LPD23 domain-containing protein [Vibrio sp. D431a]MDK9795084.1 hypothetical protein [Vibrio sp. D431a]